MKSPFKKTINSHDVAIIISTSVSNEFKYVAKLVDKYCNEDERLHKYRSVMMNESQWLAVSCGLAVLSVQSPERVSNVIKELMNVYINIDERNGGGTRFSKENMEEPFKTLIEYVKVFIKGLEENNGSSESLYRGLIYLCDVYTLKVFDGYGKPGSSIDNYTRELSDYFFILFSKKLERLTIS